MVVMNKPSKFVSFALTALFCLLAATAGQAADAGFQDTVDRARACGVFPDSIDSVRAAVASDRLPESEGKALLTPLLEACTEKLPTAPFEDKLAEGLAKRVPTPLIVRALDQKLDAYRFINTLLVGNFEKVDPELLVVLGEGVSKGAPQSDVAAYVSTFSKEHPTPFLTGAHMVSLLGQAEFNYELTRSMLETAFAMGGPSSEWRYFIRLVLVARKRGLEDKDIASAARKVLGVKGSLNDLSARLGFTSRSLTGRSVSN